MKHTDICLVPVFPLSCLDGCFCHYSIEDEVNTFDCRNNTMTQLPDQLLPRTENLIMTGNHLTKFSFMTDRSDLYHLKTLNLENNLISTVDEVSLKVLLLSGVSVKLTGNKLKEIPPVLANTSLTADIWLAGNPYECNCDMMQMKDWLQNASHVIDKHEIKCGSGHYQGETS